MLVKKSANAKNHNDTTMVDEVSASTIWLSTRVAKLTMTKTNRILSLSASFKRIVAQPSL